MTKNSLITGGCGFIGSHIADALVRAGHRVRILDNLSSGYLKNIRHLGNEVEFIEGDIRDRKIVERAIEGIQFVFHEAALVSVFDSVDHPEDSHDINITGTLNILMSAKKHGVKRIVAASSAAVYGNEPTIPKTEDMIPQPESPYAIGKITDEYYLRVFATLYGVETISLRYFNVYGARQDASSMYSGVISKFAESLIKGQTPRIFGNGTQTRDFVFVEDVVQANLLAMSSSNVGKGEVINIATGVQTNLLQLLKEMNHILGTNTQPKFSAHHRGDIRASYADITRAKHLLGYESGYDLNKGLEVFLNTLAKHLP